MSCIKNEITKIERNWHCDYNENRGEMIENIRWEKRQDEISNHHIYVSKNNFFYRNSKEKKWKERIRNVDTLTISFFLFSFRVC